MASNSAIVDRCAELELIKIAVLDDEPKQLKDVLQYVSSNANDAPIRLRAASAAIFHVLARVQELEARIEGGE